MRDFPSQSALGSLHSQLASFSQPIKNISKANRDFLARVFLRWTLFTCVCFDWLIVLFVCFVIGLRSVRIIVVALVSRR